MRGALKEGDKFLIIFELEKNVHFSCTLKRLESKINIYRRDLLLILFSLLFQYLFFFMALCIIMIFCNFTSRGFFKKKGTDAFFTIFFSCQKFFIILCNKDIDHSFVQWFRIEAILFCIFIFFYLMKYQYFIYIYC